MYDDIIARDNYPFRTHTYGGLDTSLALLHTSRRSLTHPLQIPPPPPSTRISLPSKMVLNNPAEPSATEESYNPPTSSPDPYSKSDAVSDQASTTAPYSINTTSLPSPLPIIGPLFGYSKEQLAEDLQQRLAIISAHQKRRLSADEVKAFAYHAGRANAISSWGIPSGILVGMFRANATWAEYRHPFTGSMKSANSWFDGQRIKILGREVLRGEPAQFFVHAIRTTNYIGLNAAIFGVMATFYGTMVQLAGEMRDPCLKEFIGSVKGNVNKAATRDEKLEEAGKAFGYPPRWKRGEGLEPTVPRDEWRKARQRARAEEAAKSPPPFSDDDASPLSAEGYDGFISDDNLPLSGTDDAYNNNTPNANNNGEFPPNADTDTDTDTQAPPRKPSRDPQSPNRTPRPYPPSPSATPADTFSSDGEPAPSAWERIRREAESTDSAWPAGKE